MTDSKEFGYRSFDISDILKQGKKSQVENPRPKVRGSGLTLDLNLYLAEGRGFVPMRIIIQAGRNDIVSSYRAAFLLANERVRGVDYSEIEVKKFYRTHVPEGWHQNILDPNLDPDDPNQNRHESLDWTVTDFADFIRQVCRLWNIDLGIEEGLL